MDLKRLFGLRPKEGTVVEIAAALRRADEEVRQSSARVAEIEARRASVLLDGSENQVVEAEAELASARASVERAELVASALKQRLSAVRRSERVAEVVAMIVEANQKAEAAEAAIVNRYPALAAAIVREVLIPEQQAIAAVRAAGAAKAQLERELGALSGVPELRLVPFQAIGQRGYLGAPRRDLGAEVRLPSFNGLGFPFDSFSPIWPPAGADGSAPGGT